MENLAQFWSISAGDLLQDLHSTIQGLTTEEAKQRLDTYGFNLVKPNRRLNFYTLLWSQFNHPIILILAFAAVLSFFLHDTTTGVIVLSIIFISGFLSFWQEYRATNAVQKLISLVQVKTTLSRDGSLEEIPVEEAVPGDITALKAGDIIPGDCFIMESRDLFVDEAVLTGETYPVEKNFGVLPPATPLNMRTNTLFLEHTLLVVVLKQ